MSTTFTPAADFDSHDETAPSVTAGPVRASRSGGPKSAAGKAVSSRNAIRFRNAAGPAGNAGDRL